MGYVGPFLRGAFAGFFFVLVCRVLGFPKAWFCFWGVLSGVPGLVFVLPLSN